MKKRILSVILAVSFAVSMCTSGVTFADDLENEEATDLDFAVQEAKSDFEAAVRENSDIDMGIWYSDTWSGGSVLEMFEVLSGALVGLYESGALDAIEYEAASAGLQEARNNRLDALGEEYYILTKDNVGEIETELQTDLSQIGIEYDADSSFLILVGDWSGSNNREVRSSAGTTTTYTYNGVTYYLRMLTVTSSDYSSYAKSSSTNLLTSKTASFVKNLLNSLFQAVLSNSSQWIGYIGDLLGISVSSFGLQGSGTYLNATLGATWKRVYRQVWNASSSTWVYGSCVECAVCTWSLDSFLYNSKSAKYESDYNSGAFTKYSSYYYDTSWQQKNAVIGYINGRIYYDKTGSVSYNFGTSKTITLSEPAA